MDAGVFQLSVFPHQSGPERRPLLSPGETLEPDLLGVKQPPADARVSLIVPTFFNVPLKHHSLRHLLDGISGSQTLFEVILVTSGDGDESLLRAGGLPPELPVTFVACEPNRRAAARNAGAAAATGNYLLFLDDDMLLHDWASVDAIIDEMCRSGAECALFPRRHYLRFPTLFTESAEKQIRKWRHAPEADHDESVIYDPVRHGCAQPLVSYCFPGCFMLITKDAYAQLDGFPEEFEGWGFEDTHFAILATTHLRILNLYRRSCALLHIDHPVSPYKSDEYQENYERFCRRYRIADVARMVDRAVSGDDFLPESAPRTSPTEDLTAPLRRAGRQLDTEFPSPAVLQHFGHVADARLERTFRPSPEWVLLHGSRGRGTARADSDYDILILFRRGISYDFFVDTTDSKDIIEIEYSDCGRFEQLAAGPALAPTACPLELAKLAQAVVLDGDSASFIKWRDEQLELSVTYGRAIWFLHLLWARTCTDKSLIPTHRLIAAVRAILECCDPHRFAADLSVLESDDLTAFRHHTRTVLDQDVDGWRSDMAVNKRVFAYQSPELWHALHSVTADR